MEKSWKMEIYHKKIDFLAQHECDIPGNILMHLRMSPLVHKIGY